MAAFCGLVLTRAAYVFGMAILRRVSGPDHGPRLDQATDRIERRFLEHRDMVRTTPAFWVLPEGEQKRIERELFEVEGP